MFGERRAKAFEFCCSYPCVRFKFGWITKDRRRVNASNITLSGSCSVGIVGGHCLSHKSLYMVDKAEAMLHLVASPSSA